MLEVIEKRVEIKEKKNYGSSLRPSYSINLEIEVAVAETPDIVHYIMTETGIISRETIPFEVVSNFRGSADYKPYYTSLIFHEGESKVYKILARDTGGFLRTKINYEPLVFPEELRLIHPLDFYRFGIKVLEWELHNYKHYFTLFISSKRYESFDMSVKENSRNKTLIKINLGETALAELKVPCSSYLKKLSCFKNFNIEEEVKTRLFV